MRKTRNTRKTGKKASRMPKVVNGKVLPKPTVFLRPGEDLKAAPKANGQKAPKPVVQKHPPVDEGGEIVINEQVGVHFRTTPADAPKEGETVTINFGDNKVVLVAKAVSPTKDGNRLVQAFVQKGSGDYAKLAPNKGNKATWKRGGALPVKEKKAKANGKAGNGKCPACKHPPALCTCQRTE